MSTMDEGTETASSIVRAMQPPCLDGLSAMDWLPLVERYRTGSYRLSKRVFELSDEQLDESFGAGALGDGRAVGDWSVRTLLGHLADTDLMLAGRLRRTAAEDNPVLTVFDELAYIEAGLYRGPQHAIAGFVAAVHTTRLWIGQWLATLDASQRDRTALHPEQGPMTLRQIAERATWHSDHHAWFLENKLEHLLGPSPEADGSSGGCGPSCTCATSA